MLNSSQLICIIAVFDLRVYVLACTNVHSDESMYGLQRRLNSDTGHVDLQKRTADCPCVAAQSAYAQYSTIFTAIILDNDWLVGWLIWA